MYDLIDVRMDRPGPDGRVSVLRGLDLHVAVGQLVAIGGDSAARAALLHVLTGSEPPSSGAVRLNDESLADMTTKRLAQVRTRELGVIRNPPQLLDRLTAEENVELGLARQGVAPEDRRGRIGSALDAVGLRSGRRSHPGALGAADQQRVAIAQAIAAGALFLVVEEPTAAVMLILAQLSRTRRIAVVATTQDDAVAELATMRLRLDRGRFEQQAVAALAS
jgi:putative ABC transport system ATP-binding protein